MTQIGREEVLHVARLAALEVPEAELPALVEQLRRIVAMVDQLAEADTSGAPAFLAGPAAVALRPDHLAPEPLARPPAAFAPGFTDGFFAVPRHAAMEEE
ncbi:MAG: aspartyl/glutamyl-tRNA amidotransferase subunit C [Gemmatimonadales bacterium]|jgi:aspartyl-tRNA(Asn)/glutamyl-tRNA(Gln) amidotransferase subunit C|nr:aspartyl/glutamyl-tRNA amidotransferase subunit C [Gemmatimonadales bacterium]